MVRTGDAVGAMAATDWARFSQGVRLLWRKPYSFLFAGESDANTVVVVGRQLCVSRKLVQRNERLRVTMRTRISYGAAPAVVACAVPADRDRMTFG